MRINSINNQPFKGVYIDESVLNMSETNRGKIEGILETARKYPDKDIFVSQKPDETLVLRVQKANPFDILLVSNLVKIGSQTHKFLNAMSELKNVYNETHGIKPHYYEEEFPEFKILETDDIENITELLIGIFDDMDYKPEDFN